MCEPVDGKPRPIALLPPIPNDGVVFDPEKRFQFLGKLAFLLLDPDVRLGIFPGDEAAAAGERLEQHPLVCGLAVLPVLHAQMLWLNPVGISFAPNTQDRIGAIR